MLVKTLGEKSDITRSVDPIAVASEHRNHGPCVPWPALGAARQNDIGRLSPFAVDCLAAEADVRTLPAELFMPFICPTKHSV